MEGAGRPVNRGAVDRGGSAICAPAAGRARLLRIKSTPTAINPVSQLDRSLVAAAASTSATRRGLAVRRRGWRSPRGRQHWQSACGIERRTLAMGTIAAASRERRCEISQCTGRCSEREQRRRSDEADAGIDVLREEKRSSPSSDGGRRSRTLGARGGDHAALFVRYLSTGTEKCTEIRSREYATEPRDGRCLSGAEAGP